MSYGLSGYFYSWLSSLNFKIGSSFLGVKQEKKVLVDSLKPFMGTLLGFICLNENFREAGFLVGLVSFDEGRLMEIKEGPYTSRA